MYITIELIFAQNTMKRNHIDVLIGIFPRKSYIENKPLLVANATW